MVFKRTFIYISIDRETWIKILLKTLMSPWVHMTAQIADLVEIYILDTLSRIIDPK